MFLGFSRITEEGVDISVRKSGAVQIIRLKGNLTLGDAVDAFSQTTEELLNQDEVRLVLNLAEVRMIDSSGIGAMVRVLTTAKKKGGGLSLVQPSKFAIQTLKFVGLLNLFPVYEEEIAAVSAAG
jgi:anti-anti-sigma factor